MSSILASRYVLRCLYAHHHNVREPTATRRGQAKQKQSKASDMPYPKPGPGVHQVWRIRIKCIICSSYGAWRALPTRMPPSRIIDRVRARAAQLDASSKPQSTYDGPMARPRSTHGNNQWSPVHRQLRACLHACLHCCTHADHACCC